MIKGTLLAAALTVTGTLGAFACEDFEDAHTMAMAQGLSYAIVDAEDLFAATDEQGVDRPPFEARADQAIGVRRNSEATAFNIYDGDGCLLGGGTFPAQWVEDLMD